ncbi:hypothetical protein AB1Y20_018352 [Prymnesium parvum]|uniref:Tyrosine decarboxylase n=1 Tax=Prymnesium parvum TaxID=97485 RepID=A0AB34JRP7_PRYPA
MLAPLVAVRGGSLHLQLPLLPAFASLSAAYALFALYRRRRDLTAAATSPHDFLRAGTSLLRWLTAYREVHCRSYPVISASRPNALRDALPPAAPEAPEPFSAILSDCTRLILPALTHWENSAKFFAYFKPHSSYPAVLAELMAAGLNVMGFDWIASPAATELEVVTLDWLGDILHLPPRFLSRAPGPGGAVIQGSAGEAAIVVLLAATRRAQRRAASLPETAPPLSDVHSDTNRHRCVVYCSDQTHAIVTKACLVLGLSVCSLPTTAADGYTLRGATLSAAIAAHLAEGKLPVAVVATSGTTTSCAFDPLAEIAAAAAPHSLWVHVDAAYGGAYACLDEVLPLFAGLDACDSFCVNAHKKLLCPFDLAALYVADRTPLLAALSLTPEYLRNDASESGAVVDFEHWQLGLGRRFRALKLWFVLRRFGASGIRAHVRRGTSLALTFAQRVEASPFLSLAAPVSLSLVCFRCAPLHPAAAAGDAADDELQTALLEAVKAKGVFIIHSRLGGVKILRLACGGVEQRRREVIAAFEVIEAEAKRVRAARMAAA